MYKDFRALGVSVCLTLLRKNIERDSYDLYLKKKSGRYIDFKVQYWRERPGRQNNKFSLVPSLNFIFPAGICWEWGPYFAVRGAGGRGSAS